MEAMVYPKVVAVVGAILALAGCSATSAQQAHKLAPDDVVASVGASPVTLAEVDEKALQMPAGNFGSMRLSQVLYEARRTALDDIINQMLIDHDAKARGLERAKLVEEEITSKVVQPTDDDIATWYAANQGRLQTATLDQARLPIKAYLIQERTGVIRNQYLERLKSKTAVRIMLEPPRVKIATAGKPAKGPASAPIELIEFSDFQCPFCLRAHPTVQQVLDTYGDRIHLVYRHYPLPSHPNARPAAEAAQCADEQGQFWKYHDTLFGDQTKLSDTDLKATAAKLGLDAARFNACFDSRKYKAVVDADIKEGDEAGVSGTPAFYINGRALSGAQPYEAFKRVIDEELARSAGR